MSPRIVASCVAVSVLALAPTANAQEVETESVRAAAPPAYAAYVVEGPVSFYGRELAGRKTSNGERFDPDAYTMAHKTLPFGTMVRITNLRNNNTVIVRVNDRGPFTPARVGDVSASAARALGMRRAGVVAARLEVVDRIEPQNTK